VEEKICKSRDLLDFTKAEFSSLQKDLFALAIATERLKKMKKKKLSG